MSSCVDYERLQENNGRPAVKNEPDAHYVCPERTPIRPSAPHLDSTRVCSVDYFWRTTDLLRGHLATGKEMKRDIGNGLRAITTNSASQGLFSRDLSSRVTRWRRSAIAPWRGLKSNGK